MKNPEVCITVTDSFCSAYAWAAHLHTTRSSYTFEGRWMLYSNAFSTVVPRMLSMSLIAAYRPHINRHLATKKNANQAYV